MSHLKHSFRWLKSVNSNFALAVHSLKFGQAKTHFLSHHNVCYIDRFLTNDQSWSTSDHGFESWPSHIFFLFFPKNETKSESWPVKIFGECTARVKLDITDFNSSNGSKCHQCYLIRVIKVWTFWEAQISSSSS